MTRERKEPKKISCGSSLWLILLVALIAMHLLVSLGFLLSDEILIIKLIAIMLLVAATMLIIKRYDLKGLRYIRHMLVVFMTFYISLLIFFKGQNIKSDIIDFIIIFMYSIWSLLAICKKIREEKRKEEEAKCEKIIRLKNKYEKYIELVERYYKIDFNYLILFEENIQLVLTYHKLHLSSFIEAACLMYAIIKEGVSIKREKEEILRYVAISIRAALEIISEPYEYKDEGGILVKVYKSKVIIPENVQEFDDYIMLIKKIEHDIYRIQKYHSYIFTEHIMYVSILLKGIYIRCE